MKKYSFLTKSCIKFSVCIKKDFVGIKSATAVVVALFSFILFKLGKC